MVIGVATCLIMNDDKWINKLIVDKLGESDQIMMQKSD